MAKFVKLSDAAKRLGMTVDQLNQYRKRNQIIGQPDGSSWKFREEELERFAEEKNISLKSESSSGSDYGLLDSASQLVIDESSSGDVHVGADQPVSMGASDIKLSASDSGNVLGDEPVRRGPSDTGKLGGSGEDLFEDDLHLEAASDKYDSEDISSDFEDSDMVMEDSDSSDEVAMPSGASDVSLRLSDSGVSLDEPLSAGGSDIDSLELPDDDDFISLDEAVEPDSDELRMSEDDFNLTPQSDALDEDSSSGSQIIALEDSAIYSDESAPTMLSASDEYPEGAAVRRVARGGLAAPAGVSVVTVPAVEEAQYSVWSIAGLAITLVMVAVGAMVAFDLARNIYQPQGASLSNSVLEFFINMTGNK